MLLKDVFDKTAFVKFKISNNFKQNIDKTHSKQQKIHRKIHTGLWILKKSANQMSLAKCFWFPKKKTIGYGFKKTKEKI
jgi:hypothetical protein